MSAPVADLQPVPAPLTLPLLLTLPLCVYVFVMASLRALAMQPAAWTLAKSASDFGSALLLLAPLAMLILLLLLSWLTVVRIVFRRALMTARLYVSLVLLWTLAGVRVEWADTAMVWRIVLLLWCGGLFALAVALWRERRVGL